MTCTTGIALIVFLAVTLAIGALPYVMYFKIYCERIAVLEGRTEEFHSLNAPEGGMNWFEIKHSGKLMSRYYLRFNDDHLTKLGNSLFRWGSVGFILMIGLLISIVFVNFTVCGS